MSDCRFGVSPVNYPDLIDLEITKCCNTVVYGCCKWILGVIPRSFIGGAVDIVAVELQQIKSVAITILLIYLCFFYRRGRAVRGRAAR